MQPSGQLAALKWNPRGLDGMIRECAIARVTVALFRIEREVVSIVPEDRPLRRGPVVRGHEIVLARGDAIARLLGRHGDRLAALGGDGKHRRDVVEFLHALAHAGDVRRGFRPDDADEVRQAPLVPLDSVDADDVVEQPTLLFPAAATRLGKVLVATSAR